MKKIITQHKNKNSYATLVSLAIGILIAPNALANYYDNVSNYLSKLNYYAGIDYESQSNPFKDGYGAGFLPESSYGGEYYFGGQSTKHFGFELGIASTNGWEWSKLSSGQRYPGTSVPLQNGTYMNWDNTYDSRSYYLGINRYYQLLDWGKLRCFGFAGLSYTKLKVVTAFFSDDLGIPSPAERDALSRTYEDSRLLPMLRVGLEQNFTTHFGYRLAYTWKNTASFGEIHSNENPTAPACIAPKNTNIFDVGIVVIF